MPRHADTFRRPALAAAARCLLTQGAQALSFSWYSGPCVPTATRRAD